MFKINLNLICLILFWLIHSIELKKNYCKCPGVSDQTRKGRVFGGTKALINETLPFIVDLYYKLPDQNKTFCAGSIITPLFVLTAIKCLDRDKGDLLGPSSVYAVARLYADIMLIERRIIYSFHNETLSFGLFQAQKPFLITPELTSTTCILRNQINLEFENLFAGGYGDQVMEYEGDRNIQNQKKATYDPVGKLINGKKIRSLAFASFNFTKSEHCEFNPNLICASSNKSSLCKYDQGAPLLISLDNRMYQVGVFLKNIPITIDYRENICGPGLINIFAAINKPVLDWIQSITQNAACFADLNMKIQ